jgi:hypothetical protein
LNAPSPSRNNTQPRLTKRYWRERLGESCRRREDGECRTSCNTATRRASLE